MIHQEAVQEISREELGDFINVAAGFAADIPGKEWAKLDVGDENAIHRAWDGLHEIGFDLCTVPEAAGGAGLPAAAVVAIVEEIAAGDGGVALLTLLANVAAETLSRVQLEGMGESSRPVFVPTVGARRRDARLPQLADGELTGEASFVLGGVGASGFVVACENGADLALAFVADGTRGLTVEAIDDQLALGAARASRIEFDSVAAERVGGRPEADHAESVLNLGIAAIARGTARRARELAQEYAENRYQGGGQIIIHGAVRDMLARMSERELGMKIPQVDAKDDELAVALATKIALSDAAVLSTIDAIQVFGGMGYMRETGVEKLMRDAKYCQLYPRSNWIARDDLLELQRRPL